MKKIPCLLFALLAMCLAIPARAQTPAPPADEQKLEPVDVFQDAGILVFESPDHQFKWWLDGRVMLDSAFYFNSDNVLANGAELRRGRFAMNFNLWTTWAAQFDGR